MTGRTEPSPSKLGCVQSHEQPAARDRVPSRRAAPKPHPTLPCCAPVRGDCTVTPASRRVLPSGPLHRLRGCRAVAVLGPGLQRTTRRRKKPFRFLSFLALAPPQSHCCFFSGASPSVPRNTGFTVARFLRVASRPRSAPLPPPAGAASPPPPPSATSCPCQPLGSQETGLLCSDSGPALCAKPALLPLWGVTSPLKSLTVRSC